MSTDTSIGPEGQKGGNENHGTVDGRVPKTLGEQTTQQPPAGADVVDQAGAEVPAGVPGARPRPGIGKGPKSYPDGPNVEASPWELEAARGNPPRDR